MDVVVDGDLKVKDEEDAEIFSQELLKNSQRLSYKDCDNNK
jgi:hypothetical protein